MFINKKMDQLIAQNLYIFLYKSDKTIHGTPLNHHNLSHKPIDKEAF